MIPECGPFQWSIPGLAGLVGAHPQQDGGGEVLLSTCGSR